ncbi:MAG TPA: cupredoxin domain-containing protein [Casimicrobiaceae bacterium]
MPVHVIGRLLAGIVVGVAAASLAAAAELPTFAITIKDGRIDPPRLEIPAGTKVKLTLRNEGPGAAEFESTDLRVEKVLAPGASSFLVLPPLKPGTYRAFDEFHPSTGVMLIVAK